MFRSILVFTDFSPASWKAFHIGLDFSMDYQASLSVLHVYPTNPERRLESLDGKILQIQTKMENMTKQLTDENRNIEHIVKPGNVEEELLKIARRHEFDLLIVGVNGNGQNDEPGKHAVSLIENSNTPLLIIPNSYHLNV